jgi:antitoxin CcdA
MDTYDPRAPKRATNVSLNADLVEKAKARGINLSKTCEEALEKALGKALAEEWKRENAESVQANNELVERLGIPFSEYHRL